MEEGLGGRLLAAKKRNLMVLILVLVEEGLGERCCDEQYYVVTRVLILVLVEEGLGESIFCK